MHKNEESFYLCQEKIQEMNDIIDDLHNFNNIISNPKSFFKNKYYAIIFAHGKDSIPRARGGGEDSGGHML